MSSIFEIQRLKNIAKIKPAYLCRNMRFSGDIRGLFVSFVNNAVDFLLQHESEQPCTLFIALIIAGLRE